MQYVTSKNGLLLLAAAVLFCGSEQVAFAGKLAWMSDYTKAKQAAVTQSKPMLIMFTASWCGPCQRMKSTTLSEPSVEKAIEESFVPVMIDTDANPTVTRKFGITAMPTMVVVHPVTEKVDQVRGSMGRTEFMAFLNRNKQDLQLASATEMKPDTASQASHETVAGKELLTPYCLVTIVEEGKLVSGNPAFSAQHAGLTIHFSSAEKRDQFVQNPSAYFPELDGACPVVLKDSGKQVRGEARWAVEYDNHLFFCQSRENALQFLKDPARYSQAEVKVSLKSPSKATVN